MRNLILISILFLLGCSTKKSTYEFKEHQKFDSITYHSEKIIYPSLNDTVYIKSPCDSLGNLKPFKQSFVTAQGKISIEGKDNQITAKIDLKGTSTTDVKSSNTSKDSTVQDSKSEVVKNQFDWKLILALILSLLVNVLFIYNAIKNKITLR